METTKKLISFILPVYNEEGNILNIHTEICDMMKMFDTKYTYEILFIDDGSYDTSWEKITTLCKNYTHTRGVSLSRNFGKEIALSAGLHESRGDAVITLDADGQHPVHKIHDFLDAWEEGYDIVYNVRIGEKEA